MSTNELKKYSTHHAFFRESSAFVAFVVHVPALLVIVSIAFPALVGEHFSGVYPIQFFLDPV